MFCRPLISVCPPPRREGGPRGAIVDNVSPRPGGTGAGLQGACTQLAGQQGSALTGPSPARRNTAYQSLIST